MMSRLSIRRLSNYLLVLFWIVLFVTSAAAQTKPEKQAEGQDDVVRVDTTLVQTDVMVFDKQGHFVDGLKLDQFELKIDNKPQPIAFFERVASGSLREEKKSQATAGTALTNPSTATLGRTLIFFVDDLHLAPDSLESARSRRCEALRSL